MSQDDLDETDENKAEGESVLLKDLRRQLKEANARNKKYEAQEESFNKVRESSAESLLMEAGYPKMLEDVLEKVEGIPSKEQVDAFLEARGLKAKASATDATSQEGDDDTDQSQSADSVAAVAGLGQQVASAAQRTDITDLQAKIEAANTQDELDAVMVAAGLSG